MTVPTAPPRLSDSFTWDRIVRPDPSQNPLVPRQARLVSLLEIMISFPAKNFLDLLRKLEEAEHDLEGEGAGKEAIGRAATALGEIGKVVRDMGFESLAERMESDFKNWQNKKFELGVARYECKGVREALLKEFQRHLFFQVPYEDREWYEKRPLSSLAAKRFPTADDELSEAGKCFALDRHTAVVYHSMRALEVGLVALAKRLEVKIDKRQWGPLIDDIGDKIEEIRERKNKSLEEREFLKTIPPVAIHFRFLTNAWRNIAMHESPDYSPEKAQEILAHSKDFLEELAGIGIKQEP